MKFVVCILLFIGCTLNAVEVSMKLLNAIAEVESSGKGYVVGDGGKAVGKYQIHKQYVDEVNRILKLRKINKHYTYNDRLNPNKSMEMVAHYLTFWGRQYEKRTGKPATMEVLAKIHNGHAFWTRNPQNPKNMKYFNNIENYWNKVKKELKQS